MMVGQFRVSGTKGIRLIIFGPKDIMEANDGVPQCAFAIHEQFPFDADKLAVFLNEALRASHNDPRAFADLIAAAKHEKDMQSKANNLAQHSNNRYTE